MEGTQIQYFIFSILASLLFLWTIYTLYHKPNETKNPPPSPPKLPILGNLHQLLGSFLHLNLHALAKKHGPLMLLHLGSVPMLIASSSEAAREVMRTHDLTFSMRPMYKIYRKALYEGKDLTFAPYGEYWKQMRGIFVLKLLSSKRVQSFRTIREEETALFVKRIEEARGDQVNLSRMFNEFTYDVICTSAFGKKYSGTEIGRSFLVFLEEFFEILGAFGFEDFVPWLSWIDRVSGFDEKIDRVAKGLDDFLENVMQERLESKNEQSLQENFLDILLQIYKDKAADFSINRENIKALLFDVFSAGTDTSSVVLEWAMAELLRHPKMMQNLQKEVREIVPNGDDIKDEDLEKMHYLKAVIKETFRYHPPVPILLPRLATENVKMKGYDVKAGTVALVNIWAIGRDPASWDQPEKFYPERFLNSPIDFKGFDFELIPFGAGRKSCPGIAYACVVIEYLLATLVQKFEWKLPDGVEEKDLNMSEKPGITIHRAVPLLALATKYSPVCL